MRIVAACVLLLVASANAMEGETNKEPTAADLYPLQVGNQWNFVVTQQDGSKSRLTYVIRKTENIDGVELYRLETKVDDNSVLATEHLRSTPKGVFRHRFNGAELTPPLKLVSNPLKIGEEWKQTISASGEEVKSTCKLNKPVKIKVPAGEFDAYELTVIARMANGVEVESNYWLVPKVGIVMQDMLVNGNEIFTIELEKFENGKKMEENSDKKQDDKKPSEE